MRTINSDTKNGGRCFLDFSFSDSQQAVLDNTHALFRLIFFEKLMLSYLKQLFKIIGETIIRKKRLLSAERRHELQSSFLILDLRFKNSFTPNMLTEKFLV